MVYFSMRTLLITWIWIVTAVDIWCCQFLTLETELNPVARLIMASFGVWGLIAAKVIGTYVATEWLRHLHIRYCYAVAFIMLLLIMVLGGIIPV